MKTNKRLTILGIVLAASAIASPFGQCADESMKAEVVEVVELPPDELHKSANQWPKGDYAIVNGQSLNPLHLGPTGLWGFKSGQNIWVRKVENGSPADGKVLPNDVIYGAGGNVFPAGQDVRRSFANAITKAETKTAGGKLVLNVRRDGKLIQVPIQLQVMGSFSATTPYNCEKSDAIVARAEAFLRAGLRPEKGLPDNNTYMYGPWNDSVLFLMATGNPELQGLVRRHIRNTIARMDNWKVGKKKRGDAFPYNGWGFDYLKLLFGEYYHRTGDTTVLPYLEALATSTFTQDGAKPKSQMAWTWPMTQPSGYGTHPSAQLVSTMGEVLAYQAGLDKHMDRMRFNLTHLSHKRANNGWVRYNGYGPKLIEKRQLPEPLEITAENKKNGTYSSMNGKLGMAAALFNLVGGEYEKAVDMCATRCVYAFNRTNGGHGGIWFNGFWTPIGAYQAGPEKFTTFMQGQQWWRELYRDHSGAMWQTGNAREKKDWLGTGFAIHRTIPRKKLRILGAPRSMFGPDAPAYLKAALAAHRDRDYARAEKLTRDLQRSGKVPAEDKVGVDHFLNSVVTLKKSIDYDLTFTEGLLAKGNYTLANVEYPQLAMVTSPNNTRLQAIAKAIQSEKAKAAIAISMKKESQKEAAWRKAYGEAKETRKTKFVQEVAHLLPLIKDGAKYSGPPGTRKGTMYPTYSKKERSKWRWRTVKSAQEVPAGWEQPSFNDAKWKPIAMPCKVRHAQVGLFRINFQVKDVKVIKSLRLRGSAREHRNLTIYLNGKIVAKVVDVPGNTNFDLKPEALKLLKKGKNTLAITCQNMAYRDMSFRMDAVLNKKLSQLDAPSLDDEMDLHDLDF